MLQGDLTSLPQTDQHCRYLEFFDHEIVHVSSDISAKYQRPVKRKIWLWSKADLPSLRTDMQSFSQHLTEKNSIKTDVNILWTEFSKKCLELMKNMFPPKKHPHATASHGSTEISKDCQGVKRRHI